MIVPVAFRVVIRPDPIKKQTASGIQIVVDEEVEENGTVSGTIISLGPDTYTAFKTKLPAGGLLPGVRVSYARYAGKWVIDPETKEKLLVVNDEDIVAILDGGETPNDVFDSGVAS